MPRRTNYGRAGISACHGAADENVRAATAKTKPRDATIAGPLGWVGGCPSASLRLLDNARWHCRRRRASHQDARRSQRASSQVLKQPLGALACRKSFK
jgi:hypothetical protein